MAQIQLNDVSFYFTSPNAPVHRFLEIKREVNQEDLPKENNKGVIALNHVNLTIPDGQTFAVLGPSGCGKSTLLRVVSGIENNYYGKVLYDGKDMQDIPPGDRYIGMVFQNYALYPNFSNEGNLSFFFKMHEINDEETRKRIEYTSEIMGIDFKELLPRKPGILSGGQKQRVAIARAIVRAPKLFLLDEPLSNLDAKLRTQTRTEIKRLLQRFSITSLYVTHDQVEAIALADQIVIMHSGHIEQVGTYQELMDNPMNMFVAGFLGLPPMDLLPSGSVSNGQLLLDNYHFPLPRRILSMVENGQEITVGIRREHAQVSAEAFSSDEFQLQAEVEACESDFAHQIQIVHIRAGNINFSGTCPMDIKLHNGQSISVQISPDKLYFFDTKSEQRL
ncbi:MAG: ATP-binding cassette domain-containing protein [Anaerolineales bacterium]